MHLKHILLGQEFYVDKLDMIPIVVLSYPKLCGGVGQAHYKEHQLVHDQMYAEDMEEAALL